MAPTLDSRTVDAWLADHVGWEKLGDKAIARTFTGSSFSASVAFVVKIAMAAERRGHHPLLELGAAGVRVLWTTHESDGLTALDLELAEATDRAATAAP